MRRIAVDLFPTAFARTKPAVMQFPPERVANLLRPFPERIADFEPLTERTRGNLAKALQEIDEAERSAFLERHRSRLADPDRSRWLKYADFVYLAHRNVLHAERLGLDRSPPLEILDIGTGPGSFAMVANSMGHRAIGTDVRDQWNGEYCRLSGVELVNAPVRPREPYRPVARRFDLIAMMTPNFHRTVVDGGVQYWSTDDWQFLIDDLFDNLLTDRGRIFILMPPDHQPGGTRADSPLVEWAAARGAMTERNPAGLAGAWGETRSTRIVIDARPSRPV